MKSLEKNNKLAIQKSAKEFYKSYLSFFGNYLVTILGNSLYTIIGIFLYRILTPYIKDIPKLLFVGSVILFGLTLYVCIILLLNKFEENISDFKFDFETNDNDSQIKDHKTVLITLGLFIILIVLLGIGEITHIHLWANSNYDEFLNYRFGAILGIIIYISWFAFIQPQLKNLAYKVKSTYSQ